MVSEFMTPDNILILVAGFIGAAILLYAAIKMGQDNLSEDLK